MHISILNILDKNLFEYSNVLVEVLIKSSQMQKLHSGYSNKLGQVLIHHDYCGKVDILANGIYLKSIELPGIETIIISNGHKKTWNKF